MIEKFEKRDVSPMSSFYDGLSDEEKLALGDAEGWQGPLDGETIAVATLDVSSIPPDDIIAKYDRITFLRFTTRDGTVKMFNFVHGYAIDLTKLKPVEYGFSNEATIDKWSILEWNKAKESAMAQALQILDKSNLQDLKFEYAQIEQGQPVQF
jgi:hypothetical protein